MLHQGKLSVDGIRIALDDASSEVCFVSHAHSDHTAAFSKRRSIIASDETFMLLGKPPCSRQLPNGASLHMAGHMLGARQLRAETPSGVFVYTGDFSLHQSYTAPAAPILQCDTLMIDSTYALPHLRLPSRHETSKKMARFVRENESRIVVFGAYLRGKTQELVRFLNIECGLAPIVSAPAAALCEVYGKCGVRLDYVAAGTPEGEEAMRFPFVAIMPSNMVNFQFGSKLSEAFEREARTALATGWATVSRFPVDAAFPFSDHADFRDTMRYIYESGAKKVVCANSSEGEAASYLRTLGINAIAKSDLAQEAQTTLAQC
jgi:Cft2 family RNA processing exonuclease